MSPMSYENEDEPAVVRAIPRNRKGPDMLTLEQLHKMIGFDECFHAEFGILSPHLRKITKSWKMEIPMKIVMEETAQDTMTVRDLNEVFDDVQGFLDSLYAGRFFEDFEGPLDGIALTLKAHGINPGWATFAFSNAFDAAQQQLYFDTRQVNHRVYPAALRCLNKIMTLTLHILNRRDQELNDVTPRRGQHSEQY